MSVALPSKLYGCLLWTSVQPAEWKEKSDQVCGCFGVQPPPRCQPVPGPIISLVWSFTFLTGQMAHPGRTILTRDRGRPTAV